MVVSAQRLASEVGAEMLRAGGNAVDAAVAVGYALAVVHPCCGNIGGGGFATLRMADGTETFFNFREMAPAAATRDMYLDGVGELVPDLSTVGYKAVGVPGTVLGLEAMREAYGSMPREALLAPAIRLAKDGFVLGEGDAAILAASAEDLAGQANVTAIFFKDGAPLHAGDRLVQADLAATLQAISDGGVGAFYEGGIAADIVAASEANGGILTMQDFADYTVRETAPLRCGYRGYEIISSPPPSSGGTTICQILNIVEGWPMGDLGYQSSQSVHYHRRGDAPRLRRPQFHARRPGLRRQPGGAAGLGRLCRGDPRHDRRGRGDEVGGRAARASRRMRAPRRRITRSSTRTATRCR